jgi:hypothetical protein
VDGLENRVIKTIADRIANSGYLEYWSTVFLRSVAHGQFDRRAIVKLRHHVKTLKPGDAGRAAEPLESLYV